MKQVEVSYKVEGNSIVVHLPEGSSNIRLQVTFDIGDVGNQPAREQPLDEFAQCIRDLRQQADEALRSTRFEDRLRITSDIYRFIKVIEEDEDIPAHQAASLIADLQEITHDLITGDG